MGLTDKQQKAKEILKLAISEGNSVGLDTCVYINVAKIKEDQPPIGNFDLLIAKDLFDIYDFLSKFKVIVAKYQIVEEELKLKIPKLIAERKLSNKAPYYLENIRKELTFDKHIIEYTEEEKKLSEKYGFKRDAFGKSKDNRNDLLIVICSKRKRVKMIITSNNSDRNPDFDWCDKTYKEKIDSSDCFEIIYIIPADLAPVVRELKEELKFSLDTK